MRTLLAILLLFLLLFTSCNSVVIQETGTGKAAEQPAQIDVELDQSIDESFIADDDFIEIGQMI